MEFMGTSASLTLIAGGATLLVRRMPRRRGEGGLSGSSPRSGVEDLLTRKQRENLGFHRFS